MDIEVQGLKIAYSLVGEGRPILMLHGGTADHRQMVADFEPVFASRPNWQRIYPDLPGHGRTPAKDWIINNDQVLEIILDFVDRVIPGQAFVVAGTSRGAYLARGINYRRPQAVDGALLIVPARYAIAPESSVSPHITLVKNAALLTEHEAHTRGGHDLLVVQSRETLEKLRQNFYPAWALSDSAFHERIMQHYEFSFDVDALPERFEKPALILAGRQDDSVGYRDAWQLLDQYPRATFAVLDRAGHLIAIEQEGLFRSLVVEWLGRVEEYKDSMSS